MRATHIINISETMDQLKAQLGKAKELAYLAIRETERLELYEEEIPIIKGLLIESCESAANCETCIENKNTESLELNITLLELRLENFFAYFEYYFRFYNYNSLCSLISRVTDPNSSIY